MKRILLTFSVCILFIQLHSQVSINPFGIPADSSAILDISHDAENPKGILIPRLDLGDIYNIPSPAAGLLVYDTLSNRFMYYNGSYWNWVGEGFWYDVGPGIQSNPDNIGIGTPPDLNYGIKVNHPTSSGVASYSGTSSPSWDPLEPTAFFGYGANGSNAAHFITDSTGTALFAASESTGHAGKFVGGNVYIQKNLGIGLENPSVPLYVKGTGNTLASFNSTANTAIELQRNGFQRGFLQIFNSGGNDDFYLGKSIGAGAGDVYLYNQGRSLRLRNTGTFEFNVPASSASFLMTLNRNGVQQGFIEVRDDILNGIPNVLTIGKPGATGDIRFDNDGEYIVFESDGDVGIGTNSGLTFIPVNNKLRIDSDKTTPALSSNVTYFGNNDVVAVEGISTPAAGYGYGGWFKGGYYGLRSEAAGTTYAGDAIGVYAKASGSAGTRIGLYATASGGTSNWAGFFQDGNVHIAANLRIGNTTGAADYKLSVDGKIIGEELKIQDSGSWPDYVFDGSYHLMSLEDVEDHITMHKHLPGIPSAAEVAENGILVGDMQKKMMEKIEELTLHVIELKKRIVELETLKQ